MKNSGENQELIEDHLRDLGVRKDQQLSVLFEQLDNLTGPCRITDAEHKINNLTK